MPDVPESKLGRILKIALPIVISRASYTVMLFVDRLFLSRVGKHGLAAARSGSLSSLVLSSFFIGLVGYVTALAAQYYGAGRHKMCTRATTQAPSEEASPVTSLDDLLTLIHKGLPEQALEALDSAPLSLPAAGLVRAAAHLAVARQVLERTPDGEGEVREMLQELRRLFKTR